MAEAPGKGLLALGLAGMLLIGCEPGSARAATLAVLCHEDHKVRFFDGKSGKILAEEKVEPGARALGLPAGGLRLYVLEPGKQDERDAVLRALSVITGHVEGTLLLPNCRNPASLGQGASGRLLVACEGTEDLLEVSGSDGGLHARLRVGRGAVSAVFHPGTETVAIANRATGEALLYDLEEGKIGWRHAAAKDPQGLAPGYGDTLMALLDGGAGTLRLLEPEAQTLSTPIAVGPGASHAAFLGEGSALLVLRAGPEGLVMVDIEESTVQRTLELGPGASGLAVDTAGTRAWVSLKDMNLVAAIDVENWTVEATFPMPGGPGALVYVKD